MYKEDETVANPDFFYKRSTRPIAVFFDGSVHEKDISKRMMTKTEIGSNIWDIG
jgi:hypothetical protein